MERKVAIRVESLTTGYGSGSRVPMVVTDSLSASLFEGELTCLLGPNGAGKSTLLRTLTAFQPSLSGEIYIDGKSISTFNSEELARQIGVVLTDRPDLGNMTVRDTVALGRSPYTGFWGKLDENDSRSVERAMELVGILSFASRTVMSLSDGERQKVMIAKALAQETPVIFLDEPTAFLDYPSKCEMLQLLRRLAVDERKTIFMSTHDLELSLQMADKLWLIDKSRGVRIGTPEDLSFDGSLEQYFCRGGLVFDKTTGLFRIEHPVVGKVSLTGDGVLRQLVSKALERCGIECVEAGECDIEVNLTPGNTIMVGNKRCCSIGEMLDSIRLFGTISG